jgi:tRNA threonylcarbamoyladenosine biosynthesis protein TsaB
LNTANDKMTVLGLDTSGAQGAAALVRGEQVLCEITLPGKRTFSEKLLPAIDDLLKNAGKCMDDLDLIAVTRGPGSFTGLRIGLATVKGLAYTKGIPVVGVISLKVMAWPVVDRTRAVSVALPARSGWVYSADYIQGQDGLQCLREPALESVDQWVSHLDPGHRLIGEGVVRHRQLLEEVYPNLKIDPDDGMHYPTGEAVAQLGLRQFQRSGGHSPHELVPLYLQLSMAEQKLRAATGENQGENTGASS